MASDRWKVFLDTNIFVAGLFSRTGASAAILDLAEAEEILAVISEQILEEVYRVLEIKFPHLLPTFRILIKNLAPLLIENPTRTLAKEALAIIHPNDAPILVAAKMAKVDYLVTLNTKHFHTAKARNFLSTPIVTPAEFLEVFRTFWEKAE